VASEGNKPPTSRRQAALTIDFSLMNAARRILEDSLGIAAGEKIVIVVDQAREAIGQSLAEVARALGATPSLLTMESLGTRPIVTVPDGLRDLLTEAQASILLVGTEHEAERTFRRELVDVVGQLRLRHAHLIGLTRRSMISGFTVQPSRIADQTRMVRVRLKPDSTLHLRSPAGSDLVVKTDPRYRWGEQSGLIRPGKWANLPAGQLYTTPADANGVFVANASVSATFASRGLLTSTPLKLEIKGGVCRGVTCVDTAFARDVERFLNGTTDLNRIGQVAIGTNPGMAQPIGEFGYDQCVPGLHLTFGWTQPETTGADWVSAGIMLANGAEGDLDIDGTPVIRGGRFVI
jgi:leucyl aminopeptidase (aminopeptidase T)